MFRGVEAYIGNLPDWYRAPSQVNLRREDSSSAARSNFVRLFGLALAFTSTSSDDPPEQQRTGQGKTSFGPSSGLNAFCSTPGLLLFGHEVGHEMFKQGVGVAVTVVANMITPQLFATESGLICHNYLACCRAYLDPWQLVYDFCIKHSVKFAALSLIDKLLITAGQTISSSKSESASSSSTAAASTLSTAFQLPSAFHYAILGRSTHYLHFPFFLRLLLGSGGVTFDVATSQELSTAAFGGSSSEEEEGQIVNNNPNEIRNILYASLCNAVVRSLQEGAYSAIMCYRGLSPMTMPMVLRSTLLHGGLRFITQAAVEKLNTNVTFAICGRGVVGQVVASFVQATVEGSVVRSLLIPRLMKVSSRSIRTARGQGTEEEDKGLVAENVDEDQNFVNAVPSSISEKNALRVFDLMTASVFCSAIKVYHTVSSGENINHNARLYYVRLLDRALYYHHLVLSGKWKRKAPREGRARPRVIESGVPLEEKHIARGEGQLPDRRSRCICCQREVQLPAEGESSHTTATIIYPTLNPKCNHFFCSRKCIDNYPEDWVCRFCFAPLWCAGEEGKTCSGGSSGVDVAGVRKEDDTDVQNHCAEVDDYRCKNPVEFCHSSLDWATWQEAYFDACREGHVVARADRVAKPGSSTTAEGGIWSSFFQLSLPWNMVPKYKAATPLGGILAIVALPIAGLIGPQKASVDICCDGRLSQPQFSL